MKDSVLIELADTWVLTADSDNAPETAAARAVLRSCADVLRMLVDLDMQKETTIKLREIVDVTSRAWAELPPGPTRDDVGSLQRRAMDALDDLGRRFPRPSNSPQTPPRSL